MLDAKRLGPRAIMVKVWPAILMACLTTALGLAALAWTSFPGIREIALFSTVNVLSALAITRWLLPLSLPSVPKATALQRRLSAWLFLELSKLKRLGLWLLLLPIAALVILVTGSIHLQWSDDLQKLTAPQDALLSEDLRVRERVSSIDMSRFVVAFGKSEQEALEINDRVYLALQQAREAKEIRQFYSLHSVVWSEALQKRNREAMLNAPSLVARMLSALENEGFDPSKFQPFADSLSSRANPLTAAQLAGTPLDTIARGFINRAGNQFVVVSYLQGIDKPDALRKRLSQYKEVSYFDQKSFVQQLYSKYRQQVVQLILVGLVLVFFVLFARYRRVGPSLAALTPALLAGGCAVGILAICGVKLNLLHAMSILLVLSMGVDFGVFLVESDRDDGNLAPALLSILVSGLVTVLSFGLLAMSAQPALSAIGQITALGMLFAILLSPIALVLLSRGGKR